ncbi:MAG: phosphopantetheine adenylyltransferase [Gammaproteobacteria bacterium]|nr:phosphopantetheine adenylyltransferase [Gammaproteobacteria bacterium]
MSMIISVLLVVVAIIHLLPLSGVLSAKRLTALYGLSFDEPNLEILMRHRAVLFGLLGVFLIYAAFKVELQPIAFVAGFVSVISFIFIAKSVGGYNTLLRKVVLADWVALGCLVIATIVHLLM